MPSKSRAAIRGHSYHFVQRGKRHQPCFFQAIDYLQYLDLWYELSRAHEVAVHAFVLMPDQVRFLLTPRSTDNSLATLSRALTRCYQDYFSDRYQWSGTLWEERHCVEPMKSPEDLLGSYRSIELSPVDACLVKSAVDYPWSSYATNALGRYDAMISAHQDYLTLAERPLLRQEWYREFCRAGNNETGTESAPLVSDAPATSAAAWCPAPSTHRA